MTLQFAKYLTICLTFLLVIPVVARAETPSWVKAKPASMIYYTGVGMASKSDNDYMKKAKNAALSDLISEIQVEVSNNSILNKKEVNFKYSDSFNQEIRTKANADIEQFELVDTWSNNSEYWVYYQLDKQQYEEIMKQRIATAARKGFDLWIKGLSLQQSGNIMSAAESFCKGLEAITPYINKELIVTHEGNTYDVGGELYNSINSVFNGIAITCDRTELQLNHFAKTGETVNVIVSTNGVPTNGIKLKATFISGGGTVLIPSTTDANGATQLKISNIISKIQNQSIKIEIDNTALKAISTSFLKDVITKTISRLPVASVTIVSTQAPLRAVMYVKNNKNEQLMNAIAKDIAHNYFDVVGASEEADIKILVEADYKIGTMVKGELYNMIETFCSGNVTIFDITKNSIITSFGIDNVRSLSPGTDSVEKSRNTSNRELLKKLRPIFAQKMSEINIAPHTPKETESDNSDDENMPNYD